MVLVIVFLVNLMVNKVKINTEIDEILEQLTNSELPKKVYDYVHEDEEIDALIDISNTAAIDRFGFNDHGKVHVKIAVLNALRILKVLDGHVQLNIIKDSVGDFDDAINVIIIAMFLHDIGNSIHRKFHYQHSLVLAEPIIDRVLKKFYPNDLVKRTKLKVACLECMYAHDEAIPCTTIESSICTIADGLDMAQGRAREVYSKGDFDIHSLSALSIKKVRVTEDGKDKPLKIEVYASEMAGIFQIQGVLGKKIASSKLKDKIYVELIVKNGDKTLTREVPI